MPKRRRLVVETADLDLVCGTADPAALSSLAALKAILGHPLEGFCFLWTTVPMTNKPPRPVGWAPVVYLADHRYALVTGTWFKASLRRTGAHKPSVVGRLLQLVAEGFGPAHILTCPGFTDPRIERRMPAFGLRPLTWDEFRRLPNELQQIGAISAERCKSSPTGLYCLDLDQLPRLVDEYETYLRATEAGLWLNDHYWLDVELEHAHFLAEQWPRLRELYGSPQLPPTW